MAEAINLGLDFGSLGFRAAYVAAEAVLPLSLGTAEPTQWLLPEASPSAELGIQFPSVKSRLGIATMPPDGAAQSATTLVRQAFVELHRAAAEQIGKPPSQLVIAVPALYSAARRAALHELALAAGFQEAHLLNDSMAAVIGHTHGSEEVRTVLVYSLGYSGFEVGLIRLAKGRYWAIAYDGAPSPGGAAFDTLIMSGCRQALAKHQLWAPNSDLSPTEWLGLRNAAERLKESLVRDETVEFDLGIAGTPPQVFRLSLSRQEFEQAITNLVQASLDTAERLLDDANLSVTDLSDILLLGGSAQIGLVQRLLAARFPRQPVLPTTNLLVCGAAIYAARLGLLPTTEAAVTRTETTSEALEASTTLPVLKIRLTEKGQEEAGAEASQHALIVRSADSDSRPEIVLTLTPPAPAPQTEGRTAEAPATSLVTVLADREHLFQHARLLIEQGSYISARGFLEGLVQDAQTMLGTIPALPSMTLRHEVVQALRRSYDLLQAGRFQQAIEMAHQAYSADPENPQTFEQIIDIHCRAAMAHTSMEGYKKSIQWLMCAHSHDRTNTAIHDRIADRHFIHAQQLAEQGKSAEALKVLEECQHYNPEHASAKALAAALAPRSAL